MTDTSRVAAEKTSPFLITKEYRRFVEFCEACRRDRYIGLYYGPPGVGKTLSARHYAQWDRIEAAQDRWQSPNRVMPTEIADCSRSSTRPRSPTPHAGSPLRWKTAVRC